MSEIMTMRGAIAADQLGVTDYHEHLYVEPAGWLHKLDPDFALNSVTKSGEELRRFSQAGGRTICELTAVDFGRNINKIKAVADLVPEVNVIVTAGYNRPYYMGHWISSVSEADMIRDTVRDLTVGIDGTDVKAGIIKCGTEYNNFNEKGQNLSVLQPLPIVRPDARSSPIQPPARWATSSRSSSWKKVSMRTG